MISFVKSLPQEVPAESQVDSDDLAVVVLHLLAPHAPPADDELAAGVGPQVYLRSEWFTPGPTSGQKDTAQGNQRPLLGTC